MCYYYIHPYIVYSFSVLQRFISRSLWRRSLEGVTRTFIAPQYKFYKFLTISTKKDGIDGLAINGFQLGVLLKLIALLTLTLDLLPKLYSHWFSVCLHQCVDENFLIWTVLQGSEWLSRMMLPGALFMRNFISNTRHSNSNSIDIWIETATNSVGY